MAYLHGIFQLPGCPRYNGGKITSCTCFKIIHINNNAMLRAPRWMVDFQGMHFNVRKSLYIHFQNHHSIFRKVMISTIDCGGEGWFSVLLTSICATTNNFLPIEDRYSGLICQYALENILNVSQRFIKSLHQPTKPHGLVGQFPNRQKESKYEYDSIDAFLYKLKENIGETIEKIYVRYITGITTIYDNNKKVLIQHHTLKHQ